jgi:aryl-alcohol dehydrogenase-like predicted oxidoreductase
MEYRPLGRTGVTVSALGFGAGPLGRDELPDLEAEALLRAAVEAGITLFDAARSYGRAERRLGAALRPVRPGVVISTKGGYGVDGVSDWTGECIARGIDRALSELGTEVVDIFHLHSCPLEVASRDDILEALAAARRAGKIRIAGYAGDNEALAWAVESGHFDAVECSWSCLDQANRGAILRAAELGMGVIAKRPLANAVWKFAERPTAPDSAAYWERLHTQRPAVDAKTALRFSLYAPGVSSAIVGCSTALHLAENLAAAGDGPLPPADVRAISDAFALHAGAWPAIV